MTAPAVADILRQAGFVPVVPELSRHDRDKESKLGSRVPAVPAVPAQKHKVRAATSRAQAEPGSATVRAHLLTLAAAAHMDAALVGALPESFLRECADLPGDALRAVLDGLHDEAERKAGRVPAGDTAAILCRSCGPVWVHPSIAVVLPVVNGWPRALGCPWCFITKDGAMGIPRPSVTCGSCAHFIADAVSPAGGAGRCTLNIRPKRTPHPFTSQYCGRFKPLEKTS